MPIVQQLWLEGIPPVFASMRKSILPVCKNLVMIFTLWAKKLQRIVTAITCQPRVLAALAGIACGVSPAIPSANVEASDTRAADNASINWDKTS